MKYPAPGVRDLSQIQWQVEGAPHRFQEYNVLHGQFRKIREDLQLPGAAIPQIGSKRITGPVGETFRVSIKTPTVKGEYGSGSVYGPSLTVSQLTEVRRVVQSFKTNFIKSGMSDYEKVKAAHDYLCANCTYAYGGWQYNGANTAWGALVYGEAQCSGYARAMKALCDAMGIPCYYVHANAQSANPSHQ